MTDTARPRLTSAHVLATAAALFVPVAILLPRGVAPLFALAAVGVAAIEIAHRRKPSLLSGPVAWLMAAMTGWSLLSWFWSISPNDTITTGISFAFTLLGGAILAGFGARLDGREKQVFQTGLILGGVLGFGLILFELATDVWLTRTLYALAGKRLFLIEGGYTAKMNAGLAATSLFFWSWALAMRSRYPAVIANLAIAIALAGMSLANSDAVVVGIVAGATIFALTLMLPRAMPWALAAVIAVGVAAAPLIAGQLPNPLVPGAKPVWPTMSAAHRIIIWRNTVDHIKKHPVVGGGFDTSRALYGFKDRVRYRLPDSYLGESTATSYEPIPLHPHNGVLQVWLELGAVGAAILLGLALAVIRAIDAAVVERHRRAAALAMVTTMTTIFSLSFGAWQSWWLSAILLAAAFLIASVAPGARAPVTPVAAAAAPPPGGEIGGPKGPEPTRYGDWERKGRAIDF